MKIYWKRFGVKLLENLASVKVWLFLLPFIISTIFLWYTLFNGIFFADIVLGEALDVSTYQIVVELFKNVTKTFIAWCTFNVSLVSAIIAVREVFKVQKLKALKEEHDKEKIDEMSA